MEIDRFKCCVCPRKTQEQVEALKKDILEDLYEKKSGFSKEDDFDLACTAVEQAFRKAGVD